MKDENWTVYIIKTDSGTLYTGITNDLQRRFDEHQNKSKGARFFHISGASSIVYQESHPNRSEASKRESQIKKMSRSQKEALIKLSKRV